MSTEAEGCPVGAARQLSALSPAGRVVIADRFVLSDRLGRGGMGVVYAAHDLALEHPVALKLPKRELESESARNVSRERSLREALGLALVRHPNVVRVLGSGEACACHAARYLAMERVRGPSLDDVLALNGPLHPRRALTLAIGIARGLDAVHTSGLLHRDIKPSNVLLCEDTGEPKLADFGLVKLANQQSMLTARGVLLGTLSYMSPEHILDEPVDARSDIYSAGAMFYEMLSGERLFRNGGPRQILMDQLGSTPAPLSTWPGIAVGEALEEVVLRCLEKEPARRFESAAQLLRALQKVGDPERAPSPEERASECSGARRRSASRSRSPSCASAASRAASSRTVSATGS